MGFDLGLGLDLGFGREWFGGGPNGKRGGRHDQNTVFFALQFFFHWSFFFALYVSALQISALKSDALHLFLHCWFLHCGFLLHCSLFCTAIVFALQFFFVPMFLAGTAGRQV